MATNRQIVLESPRKFAVSETAIPAPGSGEVLLKVRRVGVCGSDMHLYRYGRIGRIEMSGPLVMGHECVADVAAVGEGVAADLVGARVAVEPAVSCGACRWCRAGLSNLCRQTRTHFLGLPPTDGAMQQYLVHPAGLVAALPEEIDDNAAVMLEPMAIALHAVRLSKVAPGRRIVILGTGVLGTCVLALLRLYRGLHVVCVDLLADRLKRASAMGADGVVEAREGDREAVAREISDAVGAEGADIVFECAGAGDTLWHMCEVAAPGAHVIVIGSNPDDTVAFSSGVARRNGLTLRFVRRSLDTLEPCIDLAAQDILAPGDLVTHEFAATDAAAAYDLVVRAAAGVLKVVIDMTALGA